MLKNQAPTEAALQLQTVSDLIQREEIVKISKKICVQVFKPTFHETTIIFV